MNPWSGRALAGEQDHQSRDRLRVPVGGRHAGDPGFGIEGRSVRHLRWQMVLGLRPQPDMDVL